MLCHLLKLWPLSALNHFMELTPFTMIPQIPKHLLVSFLMKLVTKLPQFSTVENSKRLSSIQSGNFFTFHSYTTYQLRYITGFIRCFNLVNLDASFQNMWEILFQRLLDRCMDMQGVKAYGSCCQMSLVWLDIMFNAVIMDWMACCYAVLLYVLCNLNYSL